MFIVIDFSNFCYRFAHSINAASTTGPLDFTLQYAAMENFIKRSLAKYRRVFNSNYVIIADEGADSFRKSIFPEYKAGRKTARESNSKFDFESFYAAKRDWIEFIQTLPNTFYTSVQNAEADDIMYVAAKLYDKVTILSSDKDLKQANVPQFKLDCSPVDGSDYSLKLHCVLGDEGDGIPAAFHQDRYFVDPAVKEASIKRPRCTPKYKQSIEEQSHEELANCFEFYSRNRNLIDMSMIPDWLHANIKQSLDSKIGGLQNQTPEQRWKNLFKTGA